MLLLGRLTFLAALAMMGCGSADVPASDPASSSEAEMRACSPVARPAVAADATHLWAQVPSKWRSFVAAERRADYFGPLATFVAQARAGEAPVFPPERETFTALELTGPGDVQVVILGQDPYIQAGQAHGLAFSVRPGATPPPSLQNIFKELAADLPEIEPVSHGSLVAWAKQGVLLLNAVMTVEEEKSGSHACHGWESFSDAIIRALSNRKDPLVFVLWGSFAQSKRPLIAPRHVVITGAHPSPYSANHGFFGTRPFSRVNAALAAQRKKPIDGQLPATPAL
jgi:uracil-DNA glycosylase